MARRNPIPAPEVPQRRNYICMFEKPNGEGAGFKVFKGVTFMEAVEQGQQHIEAALPYPAKPVKGDDTDWRHDKAVEDWHDQCVKIRLHNEARKAAIQFVKVWGLN